MEKSGREKSASPKSDNITASVSTVTLPQREQRNRHRGAVLWFTGLSAAGKSTVAQGAN